MTKLSNGIVVTSIDSAHENAALTQQGYSIRAVETWHDADSASFIHWDAPDITTDDLPF